MQFAVFDLAEEVAFSGAADEGRLFGHYHDGFRPARLAPGDEGVSRDANHNLPVGFNGDNLLSFRYHLYIALICIGARLTVVQLKAWNARCTSATILRALPNR